MSTQVKPDPIVLSGAPEEDELAALVVVLVSLRMPPTPAVRPMSLWRNGSSWRGPRSWR